MLTRRTFFQAVVASVTAAVAFFWPRRTPAMTKEAEAFERASRIGIMEREEMLGYPENSGATPMSGWRLPDYPPMSAPPVPMSATSEWSGTFTGLYNDK